MTILIVVFALWFVAALIASYLLGRFIQNSDQKMKHMLHSSMRSVQKSATTFSKSVRLKSPNRKSQQMQNHGVLAPVIRLPVNLDRREGKGLKAGT